MKMPDALGLGNREREDRELITRFSGGDREAFTLIYRLHSPAVYRFALHMSGDRMKAAEITQDVFVWLVEHAGNFDAGRGELGAFLIGVTRKFLLRKRQSERRWVSFDASPAVFEQQPGFIYAPSAAGDADETAAARLRAAIAALPARYREVVVLCDLEGNTYEAVAAVLECALGTVRSRLHRARGLLGRKLHSKKESERCAI